jgi:hypothetical protein
VTARREKALRVQQLTAVVTALRRRPGRTALGIGLFVPVPQPSPEEARRTGLLMSSAPVPLVLSLLQQLEQSGKVRSEQDGENLRWYLVTP